MNTGRKTFLAVARFRDGATPEHIRELIPAEKVQASILEAQGIIGSIRVAMPKRTVFIELFAESELEATANLESLPLAALWDAELFEFTPPAGTQVQ